MAKCDDDEVKHLFQNVVTTMTAVLELDKAIQTVVVTVANIEELKLEDEECVNVCIKGKDIVSVRLTGFGKRLIYQLAPLVTK